MPGQISTAISDAFLAMSAFHAAYRTSATSLLASVGFLFLGAAASCGVVRFWQERPSEELVSWHKYASWLAGITWLPYLGAAYCQQSHIKLLGNILLAASAAALLLQKQLAPKVVAMSGDIIGGLSMAVMLLVSVVQWNFSGILGSLLYVGAGLMLKSDVSLGGITAVDLFHYALMLGNISMTIGLIKEPEPIYYRPT